MSQDCEQVGAKVGAKKKTKREKVQIKNMAICMSNCEQIGG
jgi:ribosomal protein L20A (L18A)